MSRRVALYDTTLRDGSQGEGVNFSVQDKLQIVLRLDELGFDFVEGGYPLSNPKDAEFFARARDLDLKHATLCAFGMTRRKGIAAEDDVGLNALLDANTPAVTVVGKTWDLHVTEVLRVDRAENRAMIADSVAYLHAGSSGSGGRRVIYDAEHFFDGYRSDPEFALETLRSAAEAGAEIAVLCDTNGGSLPGFVAEAVAAAVRELPCPVGIHCHNDSDLATANTLAAVEAGAVQVQGTINGVGERCGNADLVAAAANLSLKLGYDVLTPGGAGHLTELSRYVYELANMSFRRGQPFVGSSAFAHKGGMHVHAVNRLARSYEHIDPAAVGNERRILVSELSGRSNIVAAATRLKIEADDALMRKVLDRVVELEHAGYQFEAAEASFELLVKKCAGTFVPHFDLDHYRVNIESGEALKGPGSEPVTEASIKLTVNGEPRHEVAEGDGPVNALDAALRKALRPSFPFLKDVTLTDYKVRVINPTEGTAARVRVTIETHGPPADGSPSEWATVGVSENVVEASWLALCDSVEYALARGGAADAGDEAGAVS